MQETLFILDKAKYFGTQAGEVYQVSFFCQILVDKLSCWLSLYCLRFLPIVVQVIDMDGLTLQNVIVFPPKGAFIVNSSTAVAGKQRMDFKFSNAILKLPQFSLTLPPVGAGW
jgi:PAP_fibrillin